MAAGGTEERPDLGSLDAKVTAGQWHDEENEQQDAIPEVGEAMRACNNENGESKLHSANITADEPAERMEQ